MELNFNVLGAMLLFAFSTSVTPGPNNMMVLASGVNFGFMRTVPHMIGVTLGFGFMVFVLGLGLGALFKAYPLLNTMLSVAGILYMCWLAWRVANAGRPKEGVAGATPMTFMQAAAFQWVNPKAWMMAISALASYKVVADPIINGAVIGCCFMAANTPSIVSWAGFGVMLRRFLDTPWVLKTFNITMAVLLVLSLWPVVRDLVVAR